MPRRASALLPVQLLAGSIDLRAVLDVMSAALTFGQLPADTALQDIGTRLETEDRVRQVDRTRSCTIERADLDLHLSHPSARRNQKYQRPRLMPRVGRIPKRRTGGICQVGECHLAAFSSLHRARLSSRPSRRVPLLPAK